MVLEESEAVGSERFELYKSFDPPEFDPSRWARAARDAGIRYLVFVAKHHDEFSNYDTELSEFNATSVLVPFHDNPRSDLTRAVVEAFRAEGIAIGLYYSHIDWHHPEGRISTLAASLGTSYPSFTGGNRSRERHRAPPRE